MIQRSAYLFGILDKLTENVGRRLRKHHVDVVNVTTFLTFLLQLLKSLFEAVFCDPVRQVVDSHLKCVTVPWRRIPSHFVVFHVCHEAVYDVEDADSRMPRNKVQRSVPTEFDDSPQVRDTPTWHVTGCSSQTSVFALKVVKVRVVNRPRCDPPRVPVKGGVTIRAPAMRTVGDGRRPETVVRPLRTTSANILKS